MIKILAWTGGILAAVAIGTGVYVTFHYRPDASGLALGMQRLHAVSSIALAVVTLVGLAAFVWDLRGVDVSSQVKFLLIDGREVGLDGYRRMVWAHVVVLPVLVGVGIAFVVLWTRRFARPEARPARPTDG